VIDYNHRIMMRGRTPWLVAAGLLVVIALAGFGLVQGFRQITRPVVELGEDISTRVAQIFNTTPTIQPDPVTIVREVRALARLETMQYTVEKVIIAETGQGPFGFLFGDRLLLIAHGEVIAGVDLGLIGPEDVWFDELGRAYMVLPDAEIFLTRLDNEQSYVYDRDRGLLTRGDINLEAAARRAAEAEIEQAARADGIVEQARLNAENYLYRLMRSLGIPDLIFVSPADAEGARPQSTLSPAPLSTPTP
jgi:hypothetical protein